MSSEEAPTGSAKTAAVDDVDMAEAVDAAPEATEAPEAPEATPAGDDNSGTTEGTALVASVPNVDGAEDIEKAAPKRTGFTTYLRSPVVTLHVGGEDGETTLTAHQALLVQSPYFAQLCAGFADNDSVSSVLLPMVPVSAARAATAADSSTWQRERAD